MVNNEIKIILFERSKELAYIGAFKYKLIGIRKNGELLKYSTKHTKRQNCTHFRARSCGYLFFFFFWFLLFDCNCAQSGYEKDRTEN
jgi:hypothetical protein